MKKIASALIIVLLSWVTLGTAYAAAEKRVLVLYDQGTDKRQPALNDARYLANLIGHFNAGVQIVPVAEYRRGMIGASDVVFYITYEKRFTLPGEFTSDLYATKKTVCWLNHQLQDLDQGFLTRNYGFHFKEYREDLGFGNVLYKDTLFPKGDDNLTLVAIDNPALASVIAYAIDRKGGRSPYIIHARNFWYVADSPFSYCSESDRYIVFADVLHDIMGEDHPGSHTALVRIEDVNPTTEHSSLLKIAKYLHSKNVPFAVSLVPVYIDAGSKVEMHLEDNPDLLSVLQKLPALGGTVVMHGYTHQYHGTTTDDYEFWDDVADKPVRGDSLENASLRIDKGLKELFANDVYPFAWETPHYFASQNTYRAVEKYFSIAYDRRGVMWYLGSDQFLPYPVRDIYGQTVIPENLGYVHVDNPETKDILAAARLNLSVRDGYASFFFHPFVPIKYLKRIITDMKDMGYTFRDIRTFSPKVVARDKAVITGDAKVRIETQDRYITLREYGFNGKARTKESIPAAKGSVFLKEVHSDPGTYVVVKTQDEIEPGFLKKVWRLAKADVSYLRRKKISKSYGGLTKVMSVGFLHPTRGESPGEGYNDSRALEFSLNVAGVAPVDLKAKDLGALDLREFDILVVPYATARTLTADEVEHIKEAVNAGGHLVLDGPSKLADELTIEMQENAVTVRQIRDYQFPDIPLYWPQPVPVKPIYRSSEKEYRVFCVDEETNAPLVAGGRFGKGSFLYFATLFDPYTERGYSRYPFLFEMLASMFEYPFVAERKTAEMYFDPGMRQYISIEKLAKLWKKYGINRIYAGGWHFYDKYTYDYDRLIRVCHQNGILVYCWLEPPMVSQKFWNKYPAWREKTALLKDAKVSWRYLMNLADQRCRKKVFSELDTFLSKYDWDGVNLSELYFESPGGPDHPENFTPMNDTVRKDFRKTAGFDPLEIFRPESPHYWKTNERDWKTLVDYRRKLCFTLKTEYLDLLTGIRKKKKDFEIMLTAIDVTMSPSLGDFISEDTGTLLSLQKRYDITLQIEDPAMFWSGKPERYSTLGEYYRTFVKDKDKLVLDCNVLDNHKRGEGGISAEKPTGEELRQITYAMDESGCRQAFYSEETIYENDYRNIGAVLARRTRLTAKNDTQWEIKTPSMVTIRTGRKDMIAKLDGESWYACDGENVIVPAGEHVLSFEEEPKYFDMSGLKPRLTYLSHELVWANFFTNAIEFSYAGDAAPCYALISKRPGRITVDDKKYSFSMLKSDTGYAVRLPSGNHVVKIDVGGGLSDLVETSGVFLLSLIIIFGFFTSVLFLGLFIAIQIKRKIVS